MIKYCIFIIFPFLVGCIDTHSPTEPMTPPSTAVSDPTPTPTPVPTVTPTPVPSVTLEGHFTSAYPPGLNGIAVTLYQGKNIFQTTTDATGTFKFTVGLIPGSASIVGIAKSGCCTTSLPITLHTGANEVTIPVIFI